MLAVSVLVTGLGAGLTPAAATTASSVTRSGWHADPSPSVGKADVYLADMAAAARSASVWAVGRTSTYHGNDERDAALVERWDGHAWRVAAAPTLSGAVGTDLSQVAVAGRLWTLGSVDYPGTARDRDFASWFDGRAWHTHLLPLGFTGFELAAIGPANVWVLGDVKHGGEGVRWDGHRWSVSALPAEVGYSDAHMASPSWQPAARYDGRSGLQTPELMHWSSRGWVLVRAPRIALPKEANEANIENIYDSGHGVTLIAGFYDEEYDSDDDTVYDIAVYRNTRTGWVKTAFVHDLAGADMTSDGGSGAWVLGNQGVEGYDGGPVRLLHLVGGKVVAVVPTPGPAQDSDEQDVIARGAGTTTIFAADHGGDFARYVP